MLAYSGVSLTEPWGSRDMRWGMLIWECTLYLSSVGSICMAHSVFCAEQTALLVYLGFSEQQPTLLTLCVSGTCGPWPRLLGRLMLVLWHPKVEGNKT